MFKKFVNTPAVFLIPEWIKGNVSKDWFSVDFKFGKHQKKIDKTFIIRFLNQKNQKWNPKFIGSKFHVYTTLMQFSGNTCIYIRWDNPKPKICILKRKHEVLEKLLYLRGSNNNNGKRRYQIKKR
jgi:hypothetical protein